MCVCVYVAVIFQLLSRVDSLRSHELHHSRLPCPSPSPGVCSNSCPVIPSNHLILCCPLLLLLLIFPSIRVFSSKSVLCIRWPKYRSFSFSISPFNEYSRLISFRTDWFDILSVQGLPRWLSGKESFCQCRRLKKHGFDPWVRNIPWRRKWQPTPVFLPRKFHGQRSLVGYSP